MSSDFVLDTRFVVGEIEAGGVSAETLVVDGDGSLEEAEGLGGVSCAVLAGGFLEVDSGWKG